MENPIKININVKATFENIKTGEKTIIKKHNVSCTAGIESVASRLVGSTDKGIITYMALGTGSTTPNASDTTMDTELFRKLVSIRTVSGAVASFRTFFNSSEGNGTLVELGLFGDDATSIADSGTMYAHVAINKTKTSSETLTVDWSATVA